MVPAGRLAVPAGQLYQRHFVVPRPSIWIRPFQKSKIQPPPPRGSVGLSERPKVQAPPQEGRLDTRKSPRSNTPHPTPHPTFRYEVKVG